MENNKYICEKCNYVTNLKHLLEQHNETEKHKTGKHGKCFLKKKEKEIYTCEKCNFNTTNKNNYLTHNLNNHSEKEERKKEFKYYCDSCDFGVFTVSSFDKHKMSLRHKRLNK